MPMKITLNGESATIAVDSTVAGLLQQLELQDRRVAVELNQDIVVRSAHETTRLQAGDRVEIVHAIGGG